MRVISKRRLTDFWALHAHAKDSMSAWYKVAENCKAKDFNELRNTFGSADYVPEKFTVFNVGGNNYRIVCVVHYNTQTMYIREVLTHVEYDRWSKENRRK